MTIREMQRNFMIKVRQFIQEPELESDDIEYYLNRAQEEFVKEQHAVIKDNTRNERFSNTNIQRAIENLRTLINDGVFVNDSGATQGDLDNGTEIDNSYRISLVDEDVFKNAVYITQADITGSGGALTSADLGRLETPPSNYAYYLRSRISPDGTLAKAINCRIIDTNDISKFTKTKYNEPLFREPAILIEGDTLTIIYPSDFVGAAGRQFDLTYMTNPESVSIKLNRNCLLPEHTHNDVVDKAVELKLEDLKISRQIGFDNSYKAPQAQAQTE